jgi:hypothetical protein
LTEGLVSGTGATSNFTTQASITEASTLMTVSTAVGLRRLRTRNAGLYIAGNGLLYFFTFCFEGAGQIDVAKRGGYFDDKDGVFLEQDGTTISWAIRSSVSGSTVIAERSNRGSWSDDNFDGTQVGYNLDPAFAHIGWIALEWLGVGDVWCGFVNDTTPTLAHTFKHPNLFSKPYMRTASLFPCYEIERKVAGGTPENFRAICATLKSEGSDSKLGLNQYIRLEVARTTGNTANVITPLITFRLNSAWLNSRVLIQGVNIVITDNAVTSSEIFIVKNPTFSAVYTPTMRQLPNSAIEFQNAAGATPLPTNLTITGYEHIVLLETSAAISNTPASVSPNSLSSLSYMGSNFANVADIYCLCILPNTASVTITNASIILWEQL